MIRKKYTQKEIADRVGVTQGAISQELKYNTRKGRIYNAKYAQHKSIVNRKYRHTRTNTISIHKELRNIIDDLLLDDQSPECISGHIRAHRKDLPYVSGVTIRTYIKSPAGRRIEYHRDKLYKKRYRKKNKNGRILDKRMIDTRPQYINAKKRVGDTEGDFIASGKGGSGLLFVVVDRKIKVPFLEKIHPVSIANVERAVGRILIRFPELKTFTFDNDLLFIHHKRMEIKFNIKIYFCHRYSPWEKPLVENRNKLIRKYIPKGTDISKYSRQYIRKLEEKLQRRFMKCLKYKSSMELLIEYRKRKKKL